MPGGELLALLPLVLAALVPASLVLSAFVISRQRAQFLTVAVAVTSFAAVLAYLAVVLHGVLSVLGVDPRKMAPDSVMNDVVQLDLVSSSMFVLVSTLA